MNQCASPSKKAPTDSTKIARDASYAPRDTLIPEDLNVALQNIGSRIRKNVLEGYNTRGIGNFTPPMTPFSSPSKSIAPQTAPTPIFRSSKDILSDVFNDSQGPVTPSPSPKKRSRADFDLEMEYRDGDEDEDDVMIILGPDANSSAFSQPQRPIKPLRCSPPRNRSGSHLVDPFAFTAQAMAPQPIVTSNDSEMDVFRN